MRVSCVYSCEQIKDSYSDLIVFPERIDRAELTQALKKYPNSVIAGAIQQGDGSWEGSSSWGVLYKSAKQVLCYRKVTDDMKAKGSRVYYQAPSVHITSEFCIGLLVCADVNSSPLMRKTVDVIRTCGSKLKVLCVPAEMTTSAGWNFQDPLSERFIGMNVILWNHLTSPRRAKSFVSDQAGHIIKQQLEEEPFYLDL